MCASLLLRLQLEHFSASVNIMFKSLGYLNVLLTYSDETTTSVFPLSIVEISTLNSPSMYQWAVSFTSVTITHECTFLLV